MRLSYFFLLLVLSACQPDMREENQFPPNIIFILADDMGYGDIGAFNPATAISTPALNQLADEGMIFTDAHAPAAVCVPSRYGLMTGRYPIRRSGTFAGSWIEPDRMTIASLLSAQGYHTACIGKWHLGMGENEKDPGPEGMLTSGPVHRGFDYFYGIPASLDIPPYYFVENDRVVTLPTDSIADSNTPNMNPIQGAFWRGGKMSPGFAHEQVLPGLTQKSLDFLEKQKNADKPFFMYLALPAPHTPWLPLQAYQGKSKAGMYGDFVYQVDQSVGKVLDYLKEAGMEEETLVFFSSDNGPVWYPEDVERYRHSSVSSFAGMKGDAYEGGHRMPFIARWKGRIPADSQSEQLICFTDMMATFADLLNVELNQKTYAEDSHSFLPALLAEYAPHELRKELLVESVYGLHALRVGDWVYINGEGSGGFSQGFPRPETDPLEGPPQLYNLSEDISQKQNLYEVEKEVAAMMEKKMNKYLTLKAGMVLR